MCEERNTNQGVTVDDPQLRPVWGIYRSVIVSDHERLVLVAVFFLAMCEECQASTERAQSSKDRGEFEEARAREGTRELRVQRERERSESARLGKHICFANLKIHDKSRMWSISPMKALRDAGHYCTRSLSAPQE